MGVKKAVRRWALIGIGVPATAAVADKVGRRLEEKRGPDAWSKGLRGGAAKLRHFKAGRSRRGGQNGQSAQH
jgi:hypothetical protein